MENASKALLMAGGILIIIILISLAVLMHGEIGSYQQSKYSNEKIHELKKFNQQFTGYESTSVYGYELISLINKVVDYNETYTQKGDEFQLITVKVDMHGFADKYGTGTEGNKSLILFTPINKTYNQNDFNNLTNNYAMLEKKYTTKVLNLLSTNYDAIKDRRKTVSDITGGKVPNNEISVLDIEKWREYSEFKKATFKCNNVSYYDNGQVNELDFKFVK